MLKMQTSFFNVFKVFCRYQISWGCGTKGTNNKARQWGKFSVKLISVFLSWKNLAKLNVTMVSVLSSLFITQSANSLSTNASTISTNASTFSTVDCIVCASVFAISTSASTHSLLKWCCFFDGTKKVTPYIFQLSHGAIFRTLKNWQVYFWDKVIPNICHRQMGGLVKVSLLE